MKYLRKKRILPRLAVFKLKVALQNHEECCETCRVWWNHRTPINSIREHLLLDAVKSYYLKNHSSMFTISKQWKWNADTQCLLSGVDITWEFLTWDSEKCSLSVFTSVHIRRVNFKEKIWAFIKVGVRGVGLNCIMYFHTFALVSFFFYGL